MKCPGGCNGDILRKEIWHLERYFLIRKRSTKEIYLDEWEQVIEPQDIQVKFFCGECGECLSEIENNNH